MIHKSQPVRSRKLRESARGRDCALRLPGCDGGGETTVLAHLPYSGRGMARKASDLSAIPCCAVCYDQLDQRAPLQVSREMLLESLLRAHAETLQAWVDAGLVEVK